MCYCWLQELVNKCYRTENMLCVKPLQLWVITGIIVCVCMLISIKEQKLKQISWMAKLYSLYSRSMLYTSLGPSWGDVVLGVATVSLVPHTLNTTEADTPQMLQKKLLVADYWRWEFLAVPGTILREFIQKGDALPRVLTKMLSGCFWGNVSTNVSEEGEDEGDLTAPPPLLEALGSTLDHFGPLRWSWLCNNTGTREQH